MAQWPVHSWQTKSRPTFAWCMGVFQGSERWPTGRCHFQQMMWIMELCHQLCITQGAEKLCSPSHVPIRTLHPSDPNLVQTYLQPAELRLARILRNFWEPILIYGLCKQPCVPEWTKDNALHSTPRTSSKSLHLHSTIQAPLYQKISIPWKLEAFPTSWVWESLLQTSPSIKRQQSLHYHTINKCTPTTGQAWRAGWDRDAEWVSCSNSPCTCLYATFQMMNQFGSSHPKTCLEQNRSVLAGSWLQISA